MTSPSAPLTGSIVALVTPMHDDGSVDYPALRKLIDWHIAEGTDCIGVVGTTGESPTVNVEEHCEIIRVSVEQAAKRVPIMAGCGANSTAEAIELAKFAKKVGADSQLQVVPYYNKPTQEGLYQHFKAIAQAVDMPLVPYNVPGRTGCNLLPATLARLAHDFSNIVGVKEATGDMIQGSRVLESCPENFSVLSGDDFTALPLMALGGKGVISVTSNLVPGRVAAMCNAFNKGDLKEAARIHHSLFPLHDALFFESNPIPAKTALALMGRMEAEIRLPLCPMAEGTKQKLIEVLRQQNLI